jgi:hypothetical protein
MGLSRLAPSSEETTVERYIFHVTFWNPEPVRLRKFYFTTVQEDRRMAQAACFRHCAAKSQGLDGENDECSIKLIGTEPQPKAAS